LLLIVSANTRQAREARTENARMLGQIALMKRGKSLPPKPAANDGFD
jgi:hypothetical protein